MSIIYAVAYGAAVGSAFPAVGAAGRGAGRPPPSGAGPGSAWSYASSPQYVFMALCLIKHRD
jgi:hypothetical protein